jgi:hypothetical protein
MYLGFQIFIMAVFQMRLFFSFSFFFPFFLVFTLCSYGLLQCLLQNVLPASAGWQSDPGGC